MITEERRTQDVQKRVRRDIPHEPRYTLVGADERFTEIEGVSRFGVIPFEDRGPSARYGATVFGVPASLSGVAPAGAVSTTRNPNILGVAATGLGVARDGAVSAGEEIPGQTATGTSQAPAGSVTAIRNVEVVGHVASIVGAAGVGVVSSAGNTTISGVVAEASGEAFAGQVDVVRNVAVSGVPASLLGNGLPGSVTAVRHTNIFGEPAILGAAAPDGLVEFLVHANITGALASGSLTAPTGDVLAVRNTNITGLVSAASADSPVGGVSTTRNVNVSGFVSAASAQSPNGVAVGVRNTNITGVVGSGTGAANNGVVSAVKNFAYDNNTIVEGSSTSNFNLTVQDGATIIVFVAGNITTAARVDGVNMTLVGKTSNAAMWFATGLAAGSRNIQVDRSGSSSHIVSATSYVGVSTVTGGVLGSGTSAAPSGTPSGSGGRALVGFDYSASDISSVTSTGDLRVKYRRTTGNCLAVADHSSAPVSLSIPSSGSWTSIAVWLS